MRNSIIAVLLFSVISVAFAQAYISGAVSGEWNAAGSPYIITDSTWIVRGDSLKVGPGVEVLFDGPHGIVADSAILKAIGNEADSIIFTALDTMVGFKGINFNYHSIGQCTLAYCQFSYMKAGDSWLTPITAGDVDILHCYFTRNYGNTIVGGSNCLAWCDNVEHCVFEDNNPSFWLDVHYCTVDSCIFIGGGACGGNISNSQFYGGFVSDAMGFGTISNCFIEAGPGGVCIGTNMRTLVKNCVLKGGTCVDSYDPSSPPIFINCTFIADESYFGGFNNYLVTINSIFYSLSDPITDVLRSNSVFVNSLIDTTDFYIFPVDTFDITWLGVFYDNPLFEDFTGGDYHLTEDSPCIDYGVDSFYVEAWDTFIHAPATDIEGTPRPVGDGIDIGAYEYPIPVAISESNRPAGISLSAWPNPFNRNCRFMIDDLGLGIDAIEVFDVNGRLIESVTEPVEVPGGAKLPSTQTGRRQNSGSGSRTFVWQPAPTLGSGVYLVHARFGDGQTATHRVVYLK